MATIDFPANQADGSSYNAPNGVQYVKIQTSPDVWLVKETAANVSPKLWARDVAENTIEPIFPGDDVEVNDVNGNQTTIIISGPRSKNDPRLAGVRAENLFFSHLDPLK